MPEQADNQKVFNKQNTWKTKDGEFIHVEDMSSTHLRHAKNFAQRMEEFYFKKYSDFAQKVEMIDEEADRRGIKIKDRNTEFHQNTSRARNGYKTVDSK